MGKPIVDRILHREVRQAPVLFARAQVQASSLNEDERTVEVTWTTEENGRVLRGWFDQYWEELSLDAKHVRMDRLKSGNAPVLDSHDAFRTESVIGVVQSAKLEGKKGSKQGVAVLRFASAGIDPNADSIFAKIQDGILSDVSVGYRIHKIEKIEETEGEIPVYRATDWEPFEISVVPIGADSGAKVRTDAGETNPCVVEEMTMAKKIPGTRADSGAQVEEDKTQPDAPAAVAGESKADEGTEDPAPAEGEKEEEKAEGEESRSDALLLAKERTRATSMYRVAEKLGLPRDFADGHVKRATTLNKFRDLAIEAAADAEEEKRPVIRTSIPDGGDSRERFVAGATNALISRSGQLGMFRKAAEANGQKADFDPGEFRGLTMVDMARMALERAGVSTRGKSKLDIIGLALTHRSEGGFQAVGDFPVLLESVMHKTLLASYAITPDTWEKICAVGSLSDFRPHKRYRMGSFSSLETVAENGEFRNKAIDDGTAESITAETKGNIIALSRQALVNDDMGALTGVSTMLGRAAKLSVEKDFYAMLGQNSGLGPDMADGNPLFHSSHANISGNGTALSVAALDADRIVMAIQTDPSGNEFLDLRPSILLVPIGYGGAARVINQSTWDTDSGVTLQTPNKVVGLFDVIIDSPRISGTRRYLFASPTQNPTFEVGFLDGQREPYLELKEGWRVDGVEWKVRLDYGMAAVDWRGAVTNDGTP